MQYTIQFDGGTSCNIPRLGFGNGYGSYRINDEPIHRCNFNRPMSANAAEMATLNYAIKAILDRGVSVETTDLFIIGDSQIVLNRVLKIFDGVEIKTSAKSSSEFVDANFELKRVIEGFKDVKAKWRPRLESVAVFGH